MKAESSEFADLLARFKSCLATDRAEWAVRDLSEYLGMFPGDDVGIALAYVEATGQQPTPSVHVRFDDDGSIRELGDFTLEEILGRGGQGTVYRARCRELGRVVALKVLPRLQVIDPTTMLRFRREAKIASMLDDPRIARLLQSGTTHGIPWMAFQFIEGSSLASLLESPPDDGRSPDLDDVDRLAEIFEQLARGLAVAHRSGVIHRDIKPQNIMLREDGSPVILDFGLARRTEGPQTTQLTQTGDLLGTALYSSPEQLMAQRVPLDGRTDIYSLGVTLYEAATGVRPFDGATRHEVYQSVLTHRPASPARLRPAIGRDLGCVIEMAIRRDRDHRYETAEALADDLAATRRRAPIVARPRPLHERIGDFLARRIRLVVAAAIVLCVALLVTMMLLRTERERAAMAAGARAARLLSEAEQLSPFTGSLADYGSWIARAEAELNDLPRSRARFERIVAEGSGRTVDASLVFPDIHAEIDQLRAHCRAFERDLERDPQAVEEGAPRRRVLAELRGRLDALLALPQSGGDLPWEGIEDGWAYCRHRQLELVLDRARRERDLAAGIAIRTPAASEAWDGVIADLATRSTYGSLSMDSDEGALLRNLRPVRGLRPLGIDEASGLWEFWVEWSGPRPVWIERGARGGVDSRGLDVNWDFGLVFVLLPGETFQQGMRPDDPFFNSPSSQEPSARTREVSLSPFFISKYEVTVSQYGRVSGSYPSSFSTQGSIWNDPTVWFSMPVGQVAWDDASRFCRRTGLALPTMAQWEYAARAGTHTPWWFGGGTPDIRARILSGGDPDVIARELLLEAGAGNIAGSTADLRGQRKDCWNGLAPVGELMPNPFGLHDMIGNVEEWCRDAPNFPLPPDRDHTLEGRTFPEPSVTRILRGGHMSTRPVRTRHSVADWAHRRHISHSLGFRPILKLPD